MMVGVCAVALFLGSQEFKMFRVLGFRVSGFRV